MTSGEWDLRALKALEEEEQAQFRAISESNLFKTLPPPPSIPGASTIANAGAGLGISATSASSTSSSSSQPQPQIILPTINEHCGDIDDGLDVPPLPRALLRSDATASTLSLKKKKKPLSSTTTAHTQPFSTLLLSSSCSTKPTGSFSPPQLSASPIFTPPPIRRCATLSHSGAPAVRRHFRSLHQQILGKKSNSKSHSSGIGGGGGGLERRRSRSNYNCNYTSCSGGNSVFGQSGSLSDNNDYDSTDSGSCTVPLTKDSIEMMRLMLFSATSTKSNSPEIAPSIASASSSLSATGGGGGGGIVGVGVGTNRPIKISSLIPDDSCIDDDVIDDDSLTDGKCTAAQHTAGTRKQHQQSKQRHKSFLSFTACDSMGGRSGGSSSNSSATGGSIMGITCSIRKSPTKSLLMSGCSIDASALDTSRTLETIRGDEGCSEMEGSLPKGMILDDGSDRNIRMTNHFNDLVKSMQSTKSTLSTGIAAPLAAAPNAVAGRVIHHQHPCTNVFDNELEHHIKHCSCSCNHMGYGNSMDYQVCIGWTLDV